MIVIVISVIIMICKGLIVIGSVVLLSRMLIIGIRLFNWLVSSVLSVVLRIVPIILVLVFCIIKIIMICCGVKFCVCRIVILFCFFIIISFSEVIMLNVVMVIIRFSSKFIIFFFMCMVWNSLFLWLC